MIAEQAGLVRDLEDLLGSFAKNEKIPSLGDKCKADRLCFLLRERGYVELSDAYAERFAAVYIRRAKIFEGL